MDCESIRQTPKTTIFVMKEAIRKCFVSTQKLSKMNRIPIMQYMHPSTNPTENLVTSKYCTEPVS